ncbi:MAG: helix-turn-helix transcriptional regulator [Armatimonadetes bacterium]|nr:helix-turn-helix transcriptional regulator [Armatimonadota bacterium]
MNDPIFEALSAIFGALANPTRIAIVNCLLAGPLKVTDIASQLEISQPGASQHLATLERVGLLHSVKSGTSRLYQLKGPRVAVILQTAQEFCRIHQLRADQMGEQTSVE